MAGTSSGRCCAAGLLALAVAVTGCSSPVGGSPGGVDPNGVPLGKVTQDFLRTRPEAHLQYPGAKVFRTLGADEERNYIEGGSNPVAWDLLEEKHIIDPAK